MASYDEKQEKSKTQDSGFFIFTEKFWDWSWSLGNPPFFSVIQK